MTIEELLVDCEHPHRWQLRERLSVSNRIIEDLTIALEESSLLEIELPFNRLVKIYYISLHNTVLQKKCPSAEASLVNGVAGGT